ncbi:hypothetical protein [Posidoniimonas corsicana]|uniref:hypothetical protein n=1 Tax=Posidoniimonas corsicana TaxID=1938618 RepID=UPI0011B705D8|nr:hypothetical protein [Posidoniimonas corsicana]
MSTPREGNFRLTWYNLWNNGGVPADFYGGVGANWSLDTFAYLTTNPDDELVFIWSPGRRGKSVRFDTAPAFL